MKNFSNSAFCVLVLTCSMRLFSQAVHLPMTDIKASPNFLISAKPNTQIVKAGQSAEYDLIVNPLGGFKEKVHFLPAYRCLHCLPNGVSASFKPILGSLNSKLTLKTKNDIKDGIYIIDISAESGILKRKQSLALCVMSDNDFILNAEPAVQTISIGESARYRVEVSGIDAFNSLVDLTIEGLPLGGVATFSREECSSNAVLTISTGRTPVGEYDLTIAGISGAFTHSTPVKLSILQ